jgi:hypothetical protein
VNHKIKPLSTAQRMRFHAIFEDWLFQADKEGIDQFITARYTVAPNRVCSSVTVVQACLNHPELNHLLPQSLCQRLKERNWPGGESDGLDPGTAEGPA